MEYRQVILLAGLIFASAGAAFAQMIIGDPPAKQPVSKSEYLEKAKEKFQELDANFDGFVDADEISNQIREKTREIDKKQFEHMDQNFDGILTVEEYETHHKKFDEAKEQMFTKRADKLFEAADKDNNDYLSREEFLESKRNETDRFVSATIQQRKLQYKNRDINGDGVISRKEYVDRTDSLGRKQDALANSPFSISLDSSGQKIELPEHDEDGDGRISRVEDEKFREALFEHLDKDNSNVLSITEFNNSFFARTKDSFLSSGSANRSVISTSSFVIVDE